jgi:hypothetical protein
MLAIGLSWYSPLVLPAYEWMEAYSLQAPGPSSDSSSTYYNRDRDGSEW